MDDIFCMSHSFYKGYRREGDIQKMSPAWNLCAYSSKWETNGGYRSILSNVKSTSDIQWKCRPVRKVIQKRNIEVYLHYPTLFQDYSDYQSDVFVRMGWNSGIFV